MGPSSLKSPLVIFGAGGHAGVVADIARCAGRTVTAFLDPGAKASPVEGIALINDLAQLPADAQIVIAIGDNARRKAVAEEIGARRAFAVLVHPSAVVATSARLGPGSVVMAGALVGAGATVGVHAILNSGASLDHDSTLSDFASLAPGAVTGGRVHIGSGSAIGIGAVIAHKIRIGADSVIGAGAVVVRDIGDGLVAYGNPCKPVRPRKPGDAYL